MQPHPHMCRLCVCVCFSVCACVCVCGREREKPHFHKTTRNSNATYSLYNLRTGCQHTHSQWFTVVIYGFQFLITMEVCVAENLSFCLPCSVPIYDHLFNHTHTHANTHTHTHTKTHTHTHTRPAHCNTLFGSSPLLWINMFIKKPTDIRLKVK